MCLGSLCLNCDGSRKSRDGSRKSADSPRKSRNGPWKRCAPPRKPTAAHSARIIIDIPAPDCHNKYRNGDIAQLGERCLRKAEAEGSNPFFDARRDPARFLYHHLPGQIRREARNPWVVHHHLIPLRFLPTTSVNSAQGVAMLKETLVKRAFVELQAPFVWLVQRCTSGRSLLSRARLDRVQFSSQVARSDVCSVRIIRSRRRALASQLQLSAWLR